MTTREPRTKGSNAEVAEAGFNPEEAFVEDDLGAEPTAAGRGPNTVVKQVKQQLDVAPDTTGDVADRSEYADDKTRQPNGED
ncbi:MAG: hypothetical protein JWN15_3751 [Firmicutes bacterium]|jgi:hypothetical protein|nr:hypothetical protein [Bacillota bacterium]